MTISDEHTRGKGGGGVIFQLNQLMHATVWLLVKG